MTESPDLLQEFEKTNIKRRTLLPWWMKFFCWLLMIFGVAASVCLIAGLLGYQLSLSLYGFETNDPLSFIGLLLIFVGIFKGFTAFALWFEKDYAITLGKVDAYTGIALCIIYMCVLPCVLPNQFTINIRLELVLLIPYLLKLNKIQTQWQN